MLFSCFAELLMGFRVLAIREGIEICIAITLLSFRVELVWADLLNLVITL